ncbi:SMI1/KNR4 family protein [Streptomyces sp. NBC_00162]|uniref:SMI1/KNR4 family protein n=1 Tax=Streptomyces sp. NBC_00162 TaxID=2903629 RepID=UPI00214C17A8|nr:SMI1/KNR4 family protein [Streptomyces sp. NBC_00162]UUU37562.1 SMI1/KNR4 family protein [Streptomyces sp. NBC_00162]
MADFGDLVERVAERAGSEAEALTSPVTEEELASAEAALGMALPPLLARLYREVANGGFGPGYQLFPLVGQGETAVEAFRTERAQSAGEDDPHWPTGILPILTWGCGMFAAVDCHSEAGTVLLFEPNAGEDGWEHAWFVDADSLNAWLETWLSGTGWYEAEAFEETETSEPQPWKPAATRLSASK